MAAVPVPKDHFPIRFDGNEGWLEMSVPAPRIAAPLRTMDPFREIEDLYEQMHRLMHSALGRPAETGTWMPFADLAETGDGYVVEAELPGVPRENINVEVVGNELSITGECKEPERKGTLRQHTRRMGQFEYRTMLPHDVDPGKIEAKLADGVLTVRVPKSEKAKPRKVEIKR
jgi:HSP20 family protein